MGNGKALQKLKDDLGEKGCYYGKTNRLYIDELKNGLNGIGKRVTWATYLLIGTLVGAVVNLLYMYLGKG